MKFIINLALVDFDKTGNFASAENMIRNTKFKVQVQQAVAKEFFTDKLTNVVNHLNVQVKFTREAETTVAFDFDCQYHDEYVRRILDIVSDELYYGVEENKI